jgi:purine-nucleoside phosphorylase
LATPHISASPGDFAETLLYPGDPLRARFIATRLLQGAQEVTNVRNMLGYTGEWRGRRVSVMGSGMGIPSCILYATELYREFGVRRIVRVGTCGAVNPTVALGDSIVAVTAGTDSAVLRQWGGETAAASPRPLQAVIALAAQREVQLHAGPVFSSDFFYHPDPDFVARLTRLGFLATDMETAGLYGLAASLGREALAVLAVSDHIVRGEHWTAAERESGLEAMIALTLDAVA